MNHEQEIKQAVEKFKKEARKIRESDNPYYKDKEVQDYEINALRAKLDATVAEKSNAFDSAIAQEIESAEQKAKTSRFHTTETQKQSAQYALDNYVADVMLARDDAGKSAAYKALDSRLDDMSREELAHIRLQLPNVLQRVNSDADALKRLQGLNETLAKLQTEEQERLDELKAMKRIGADGTYRRLKMTHPAYKHLPTNQNSQTFKNTQ